MQLPGLSEYQEAAQNPSLYLEDPVLKACKAETTSLGLPIARSGGFAITYKMIGNGNPWAVRFFHKSTPDLEQRYSDLTRFFKISKPSRFLDFEYQSQGVRINGQKYPLVKMEWSDAQPLERWLKNNYRDIARVKRLSTQFSNAMTELHDCGVAHGDLQHGNILVDQDITFIDYDGIYVPGATSIRAGELGHRNYQSQLRSETDFGAHLDHFSAFVISLSLDAIAHRPEFYEKYCTGENLLFQARDFVDPSSSPLFAEIKKLPSLISRAKNLELACNTPLDQLPTLDIFNSPSSGLTKSGAVAEISTPMLHQYPVIQARDHYQLVSSLGTVATVVGYVEEVTGVKFARNRQPYRFINFFNWKSNNFYSPIWRDGLEQFEQNGKRPDSLSGKWVAITGLLESYKGKPHIQITEASMIRELKGESESTQMLDEWHRQKNSLIQSAKSAARAKLPAAPKPTATTTKSQSLASPLPAAGKGMSPPLGNSTARAKLPPPPKDSTGLFSPAAKSKPTGKTQATAGSTQATAGSTQATAGNTAALPLNQSSAKPTTKLGPTWLPPGGTPQPATTQWTSTQAPRNLIPPPPTNSKNDDLYGLAGCLFVVVVIILLWITIF